MRVERGHGFRRAVARASVVLAMVVAMTAAEVVVFQDVSDLVAAACLGVIFGPPAMAGFLRYEPAVLTPPLSAAAVVALPFVGVDAHVTDPLWAAAAIEILVLQWIAMLAGLGLGPVWRSLRGRSASRRSA